MIGEAVERGELPADTAVDAVTDMLQALFWGLGFYAGFIDMAADMAPMHRATRPGDVAWVARRGRLRRISARDTSGDTPRAVVGQP